MQVMLELTQQSLAFQQERSQLTEMLQAQHVHMQQLVEENQTQETALNGLSQHAQQGDQQVWNMALIINVAAPQSAWGACIDVACVTLSGLLHPG